jgi:hypothetical protein
MREQPRRPSILFLTRAAPLGTLGRLGRTDAASWPERAPVLTRATHLGTLGRVWGRGEEALAIGLGVSHGRSAYTGLVKAKQPLQKGEEAIRGRLEKSHKLLRKAHRLRVAPGRPPCLIHRAPVHHASVHRTSAPQLEPLGHRPPIDPLVFVVAVVPLDPDEGERVLLRLGNQFFP